jgi:BirA family biotin operon repressor/biotin-[acetyl-CoA-carboxylase] ligase
VESGPWHAGRMTQVPGPGRSAVVTVEQTGSTQDDLRALAVDPTGWPHLSGLRAVRQRAGRGRGDRTWDTRELTALTASLVLRPDLDPERWSWIPLLVGCAVTDALADLRATAGLKWPNDVVLPAASEVEGWSTWRKVGGILAEVLPGQSGVLVGVGVNVDGVPPVPWATTLRAQGLAIEPDTLLEAVRTHLRERLVSDPASWRTAVEQRCVSIGTQVEAHLPGGVRLTGTAREIGDGGGLVIETGEGSRQLVMAGDVHHLRAAPRDQG